MTGCRCRRAAPTSAAHRRWGVARTGSGGALPLARTVRAAAVFHRGGPRRDRQGFTVALSSLPAGHYGKSFFPATRRASSYPLSLIGSRMPVMQQAPRGIPGRPAARSSDDPTVRPRLSMARSVAVAARTHATARRMSVSALVEHLIRVRRRRQVRTTALGGRPAQEPSGASSGSRSTADPTRQVSCPGRSVYLTGRVYAAGAGMTFSGYIEELIRRELRPLHRAAKSCSREDRVANALTRARRMEERPSS